MKAKKLEDLLLMIYYYFPGERESSENTEAFLSFMLIFDFTYNMYGLLLPRRRELQQRGALCSPQGRESKVVTM